jgi:hypothetical protein
MPGLGKPRMDIPWCSQTETTFAWPRPAKNLIFDVSDDELERAAPIIGGVASVETLNFATAILGNCACPV